jgi:hypothetical protein
MCSLRRLLLIPALLSSPAILAQSPSVSVRQAEFDFGTVIRGAVREHTFTVVNHTAIPLQIDKVRLTPPLMPAAMLRAIPASSEEVLRVKIDTTNLTGAYEGVILLSFTDANVAEVRLTVRGRVVPPIEVSPPALFVTAQRGEQAQASVDILNHTGDPVVIDSAVHPQMHFKTKLETIEEGRRFRLTLVMNPDGPAGKNRETILLKTNSAAVPELKIAAYTYMRERVYTFPESVDLGALRLDDIQRNPELVEAAAQILMVYRKGTTDFQATVTTDIPELIVNSERGPLGDRYQLTVRLAVEKVRVGPIRGAIFVNTNDPEIPQLTVPVTGQILPR